MSCIDCTLDRGKCEFCNKMESKATLNSLFKEAYTKVTEEISNGTYVPEHSKEEYIQMEKDRIADHARMLANMAEDGFVGRPVDWIRTRENE